MTNPEERDSLSEIEERTRAAYASREDRMKLFPDLMWLEAEVKELREENAEARRQVRSVLGEGANTGPPDRTVLLESRIKQMEEALREIAAKGCLRPGKIPFRGYRTDVPTCGTCITCIALAALSPSDAEKPRRPRIDPATGRVTR